uniref:Phosphorylase b kinase regulatory subunit n=1 Tax=Strigamia maritima TaxID=126957 RepID=T1JA87_STRMM
MRSRSNSGARLDYYHRVLDKTILQYQNPVTGLLPATPDTSHSWVRDNVYSILSVWGLSMAYKKNADFDEDRAKTYELEQACVKLMRGLLMCMMLQKDKVEKFKESLATIDSIHAKFNTLNCQNVVGDNEWGHLQIDATSLYLLTLAQMTASGLQIVFNLDEVAFIQNLIFYIESSYCTPDYGIWERGDKTNHGLPELNASSIGMAKAALEAMNDLDLFGARGGPTSVIHVLADNAHKCEAVLHSMLPRESNSKELDAALLSIIGYPAFAVTDYELINLTRNSIVEKLQGRYGCKRFLRDGYRTPKEDPNRLYYEPGELRVFENIECEWPLFLCYMIIDACFKKDNEKLEAYSTALDALLIRGDNGIKLVPECYAVPIEKVEAEYKNPHSQDRIPLGKCPYMWAQSLYILGKLLEENFISSGELDPLNRRLAAEIKPDVVVQVVVLAEDSFIKELIKAHDLAVQTLNDAAPIEVQPARVLSHIYTFLGRNKKLHLSGRKLKDVGILSTSKLYALQDRIFAFTPQFADLHRFYIASDIELLLDIFKNEIGFLKNDGRLSSSLISTLKKLKSGYINGTRVTLGTLEEFISTSCVTSLNFLNSHEEGYPDSLGSHVNDFLEREIHKTTVDNNRKYSSRSGVLSPFKRKSRGSGRRSSVAGLIKRSRSFKVDEEAGSIWSYGTIIPPLMEMGDDRLRKYSPAKSSIHSMPSSHRTKNLLISPILESPPEELINRSPSPSRSEDQTLETIEDDFLSIIPTRNLSDEQFDKIDNDELLSTFKESDLLEEQGDILHYFAVTRGLNFVMYDRDGLPVQVKDLLKELYDKACEEKNWAIVRHTAGMLGKRVEDLAKAVTDLLVRQKQLTVGIPPYNERTITHPLPSVELQYLIHQVYGDDESTAMLTQELIVYLAMFIRTEPHLFLEMLRLRVGLIIQVLASELTRVISCPPTEASEHLLNLSPFEMKSLLHHILSGKEFGGHSVATLKRNMLRQANVEGSISTTGPRSGTLSTIKSTRSRKSGVSGVQLKEMFTDETIEAEKQGNWIRRRKLDGSLNRVPNNFYPKSWSLLERCKGLSIAGKVIPHSLTQEMTPGELKFALQVETVLNAIPQPEYRQLVVEGLIILAVIVEHDAFPYFENIIEVENLVQNANQIFLKDQQAVNGDATLCCTQPTTGKEPCGGAAGICMHFYDSAPSGTFGTMSYLMRSAADTLENLPKEGDVECNKLFDDSLANERY